MAKASGKRIYGEFDGVPFWVAGRSLKHSHKQNEADSTAGADDYENSVPTTKTIEVSLDMVMLKSDDGGAALAAKLEVGHEGNLIYGLEGNAVGKPKWGFLARVAQADIDADYKDVVKISAKFSMAGDALLFDGITDTF